MAQVPEFLQPLIVAAAGAIPFIEGEGSAVIGIIGGLHPVAAAVAGATGNLLCVIVVVLLGARIRGSIVGRSDRKQEPKPPSKGRERFRRLFVRFGVPGASLLGPLALPTQLTSALGRFGCVQGPGDPVAGDRDRAVDHRGDRCRQGSHRRRDLTIPVTPADGQRVGSGEPARAAPPRA